MSRPPARARAQSGYPEAMPGQIWAISEIEDMAYYLHYFTEDLQKESYTCPDYYRKTLIN